MASSAYHEYHGQTVDPVSGSFPRRFSPSQPFIEDLEKAAGPPRPISPDSEILRNIDFPKLPVRPCKSAGTLAPELVMFTPAQIERYEDQKEYVEPRRKCDDHLLDFAKANICVSQGTERPSGSADLGIDVGVMQALVVCILQREVAQAGQRIIDGDVPLELQALLHRYR